SEGLSRGGAEPRLVRRYERLLERPGHPVVHVHLAASVLATARRTHEERRPGNRDARAELERLVRLRGMERVQERSRSELDGVCRSSARLPTAPPGVADAGDGVVAARTGAAAQFAKNPDPAEGSAGNRVREGLDHTARRAV